MRKRSWLRRVGLAVGALALSATAVVTVANPAEAAIAGGRMQLCAQGNYTSYLAIQGNKVVDNRDVWISPHVAKGTCQTFNLPTMYGRYLKVQVTGLFNTSNNYFTIGVVGGGKTGTSFAYVDALGKGWKIGAEGTTAGGGTGSWFNVYQTGTLVLAGIF